MHCKDINDNECLCKYKFQCVLSLQSAFMNDKKDNTQQDETQFYFPISN
jgi:hypothetical protein